jgi:hypothetical protein
LHRQLQYFEANEEKLKQLILYISQKCADQGGFGSTKLNKILYFADFLVYANTGKPLTGVEYQRLQWGPAPRRMKPILQEMSNAGQLAMQDTVVLTYTRKKPVNLVSPDLGHFSAREIAIVDDVIDHLEDLTADQASRFSHDWGGWKYASDGATIPYESVFVGNEPLTPGDEQRGLEIAREHGLLDR